MKKYLRAALVATVAAGTLLAGAMPAQASNRDNCRGNVSSIYTSGSAVVASYVVVCDRVQDRIIVSADVTRHVYPVPSVRRQKTCNNTTRCSVQPRISNPAGRQLFSGAVFAAVARRGSHMVGCGYVAGILSGGLSLDGLMTCRSADEFH
ncbi:hypothetical protein [Nonomuraea rubra]|uniref:Secreted protein n=1 Tax=Nonomuraea rubra TaxID=46180 RepID=A0A7X0TZJ7_9ACTN|nr:hypothetical protein [Nonomuraea rubra]MBB6549631.1 hypothetical protein [Nonomuraea rubra]